MRASSAGTGERGERVAAEAAEVVAVPFLWWMAAGCSPGGGTMIPAVNYRYSETRPLT